MKRHQRYFFIFLVLSFGFEFEALAAKKDFKGLFGSYRREKFTENEGNRNDFGFDLLLSTLLPITSVAKSAQDNSLNFSPLNYSTFFNVEASLWFSLGYHWAIYANVGKYSYESRKKNDSSTDALPVFHQFELDAIPAIAGVRYRLSQDDIVPYISLGIGMAYVHRKGFTEGASIITNGNSSLYAEEEYQTVACGHGAAGVEFFFAPKAGLRVEASAYYMNLPKRTLEPGGTSIAIRPKIQFQSNVWSLRYASGIFFLF